MAYVLIQGINCSFRDVKPDEQIYYSDLPQEDQFFKRLEHPFSNEDIEAMAEKTHAYSSEQATWVETRNKEFEEGVYAYINNKLKFIPGSYWCYINMWTLENGDPPDYREDEREFAVFLEYCAFRSKIYGATRPKGRRQGATSFGAFFEWFIAGRMEYKNCGTVSFNDDAAKDVFVSMVMPGFKSLLPCFQADFNSPDDGKSFLNFVKVDRRKKGLGSIKRQGLNSLIDFKSTTLNSYTNKRLSFILLDEAGRWEKLDINLYWSKISKALRQGKKKVGFGYLPTVVNPREKGGENYKRFFEKSDQSAINPDTGQPYGESTPTGCVIYIMYGTQCYAGCIDKFGESVINDPAEPIIGNDGEWITEGSLGLIMKERALLEGKELMEHRRDWPVNIRDIFAFEAGLCEFNEGNIQNQIDWIGEHPGECYLRQSRLVIKKEVEKPRTPLGKEVTKKSITPMDDAKGGWFILEPPNEANKFTDRGGYLEPNNLLYQIGVDTTQDRVAVAGSNPAITVFKKSHIVDGVELGMYPVALWISPTRLDIHFDEEVMKACMYWGCKANYEIDRRTDFYRFFCKEQCQAFLTWTPTIMKNPLKPNKIPEYGSRSGDPFQLAQMLQISKWYIDGDSQYEYNGHVHRIKFKQLLEQALYYNHLDRTTSDLFVSLQMALVAVFGEMQMPKKIASAAPIKLLPTYKIKMTG